MADGLFSALETTRLVLREFREDDADFVLRHFSDPDVARYLYDAEPFSTLVEALELIRWYAPVPNPNRNRWVIVPKDAGVPVGTLGFHRCDRTNRIAEIDYDLAPAVWGQGYMTEALAAAIAHGFSVMELNRIEAFISPDNARSLALTDRAGFQREGVMRDKNFFRGQYYDHWCVSLLRREWLQRETVPG
jgi:ribosomal-protein-alanine N-acetyltransferase